MSTYRLMIYRHGKLLGHFESDTPDAEQAVRDIASRFSAGEGFHLDTLIASGERRLLESTPDGVRLLSREPCFQVVKRA